MQGEEPEPGVEEREAAVRGVQANGVQQGHELCAPRWQLLQHRQEENVHRLAVHAHGAEPRRARQQLQHRAGLLDAGVVQVPGHGAVAAQRLEEAEEDEEVVGVAQVVGELRAVGEEDVERPQHHAHVRVVHAAGVARDPHAALPEALAVRAQEGEQPEEVLGVLHELLGLLLVEDAHVHVRDDQLVLDRVEHEPRRVRQELRRSRQRRRQLRLQERQQLLAHGLRPHDEWRLVEVGVQDGQQVVRVGLQQQAHQRLRQQRRQQRREGRLVRHQQRQQPHHLARHRVAVRRRLLQLALRAHRRGLLGGFEGIRAGGGRGRGIEVREVADRGGARGGVVERDGETQTLLVEVLLDELLRRGVVVEQQRQQRSEQADARAQQQRAEGRFAGEVGEEVDDGGEDHGRQQQHQVAHQRLDHLDGAAEEGVQ